MTNVAGAICIGQVVALYTTTRGVPLEGTKDVSPPLRRLLRPVCASRRVASWCLVHFTYFAYETHTDVKPATGAGLYCESGRVDEQRFQQCNARVTIGRSTEIAFCPRERKWFRSLEGMPLLSRFATMRLRTITASLKLRTHGDINGIPAYFTIDTGIARFWFDGDRDRMTWKPSYNQR